MKTKSIVLIVVSLGFGCIAAVGMVQVMAKNKNAEPRTNTQPVLVALTDLDINDELTPENVKVEQWPVNMIPEGVVTQWEGNEGRRVAGRVIKGFPIQAGMLLAPGELSGLNIRKGYKVYAIKVSGEDAFAGLLEPGNRVDVLGIFRKSGTKLDIAKTFLKNIRVFAVNDQTSRMPDKEEGGKEIRIVQLEVTQSQSEKIALVERAGSLRLVLRSDSEQFGFDEDEIEETEESLEELLGTNDTSIAKTPQKSDTSTDSAQQSNGLDAGKVVAGLIQAWNAAKESDMEQSYSAASGPRPHVMTMISAEGTYIFEWADRNRPPRMSELPLEEAQVPIAVPETRIQSPGQSSKSPKTWSSGSDYSGGTTSTTDTDTDDLNDSDVTGDEDNVDW